MKRKGYSLDEILNMKDLDLADEVVPSESGLSQKDLNQQYTAKKAADLKAANSAKASRFSKLRRMAGLPLKGLAAAVGPIAGIGTALMTGDASAALPEALRSDPLGAAPGSLSAKLESGQRLTPEEMEQFKREMEEELE